MKSEKEAAEAYATKSAGNIESAHGRHFECCFSYSDTEGTRGMV